MRDGLFALIMLGMGVVLCSSMTRLALEKAIVLDKTQWRCIEYLPGSADCAVYERTEK